MKQYEFSAKNVQDAITKGLTELKLNQEDVDIKVLTEGGFFSKAKIVIITDEKEEVKPALVVEVKPETKKEIKQEIKKEAKAAKLEKEVLKPQPKIEAAPAKQKEEKPAVVKKTKTNLKLEEKQSVVFIKTLAEKLSTKVDTVVSEEEENLLVDLTGEKAGHLIGYRGEGLAAIQYIANIVEINNEEKENRKRIVLNIENYKQKREEALTSLAKRMANKAIKTNRAQRLEPMNSYDRRIIHAALTDEGVTTYSKGEEPRRYLVIEPKK